jgi:hypothetical protein
LRQKRRDVLQHLVHLPFQVRPSLVNEGLDGRAKQLSLSLP